TKGSPRNPGRFTYYKLEVDGRVVYEIDALGMKRVINGVDQLAAERSALGL
ncbi:major tail tube protein, partial [Pseudomonas amygdali pv. mori str. 301020]